QAGEPCQADILGHDQPARSGELVAPETPVGPFGHREARRCEAQHRFTLGSQPDRVRVAPKKPDAARILYLWHMFAHRPLPRFAPRGGAGEAHGTGNRDKAAQPHRIVEGVFHYAITVTLVSGIYNGEAVGNTWVMQSAKRRPMPGPQVGVQR